MNGGRKVVVPVSGIPRPVVSASTAKAPDVRVLALIRRHALRGVALHMLDRGIALLRRQLHILGGHIIGKIEPSPPLARHLPQAARSHRACPRPSAMPHPPPRIPAPCSAACAPRAWPSLRQPRVSKTRHCTPLPPASSAPHPPAAQRPPKTPPTGAARSNGRSDAASDSSRPTPPTDRFPSANSPPTWVPEIARRPSRPLVSVTCAPRYTGQSSTADASVAAVQNRRHRHARRHQLPRHRPRAVVVGEQSHALARHHAELVQIGLHRRRQHDPRPVVHRKGDRALQRPRRQNRLRRRDPPETFARQIGRGPLVQPHPLQRRIDCPPS